MPNHKKIWQTCYTVSGMENLRTSKKVDLSVVIPVYGVETYLRQCVDSVLAACQGIRSEVILIDDGGKDGCPAICDAYERDAARRGGTCGVRVVHKANGGYGSAVNAGLDRAEGEWISIVEPDDWVEEGIYRTLLAGAGGDADIVKGDFQYVLPSGEVQRAGRLHGIPPATPFKISDFPALLSGHPSIWSAIYRREFLNGFGIRMKEVPGAGWVDNPFFVQTACLARGIIARYEVVYNYRSMRNPVLELRGQWRIPHARMLDELAWFHAHEVASDVVCSRYRVYL